MEEPSIGEKTYSVCIAQTAEATTMWLGIITTATILLFAVPAFADLFVFSASLPI
jgi:hypothetical protein